MSIRDNYRIDNHRDRFFIYDFCNRLICSADTKRKAEEDIEKLVMSEEESCPKFLLTCLKAKATWITKIVRLSKFQLKSLTYMSLFAVRNRNMMQSNN